MSKSPFVEVTCLMYPTLAVTGLEPTTVTLEPLYFRVQINDTVGDDRVEDVVRKEVAQVCRELARVIDGSDKQPSKRGPEWRASLTDHVVEMIRAGRSAVRASAGA